MERFGPGGAVALIEPTDPREDEAIEGIELCRQGSWRQGLEILRRVAEDESRSGELPGRVYSYLGLGVARFDKRYHEAIKLCRHGVKREFYHPENYLNLARTELLAGHRRAAVRALSDGLQVDPDHPGLCALQREMGVRRGPVVPFLSRSNPLNQLLGRIRHTLRGG